jgi:hypothetical protein
MVLLIFIVFILVLMLFDSLQDKVGFLVSLFLGSENGFVEKLLFFGMTDNRADIDGFNLSFGIKFNNSFLSDGI